MNIPQIQHQKNYTGGYHAFKKILRIEEDGSKIISREYTGWQHFKSDYISSAWLNPDGTRVPYCIPLDIDAKDTDKKWLDSEGKINWEKALAFLQKKYLKIFIYTQFVVRSTGGKGIHLGIAISPIVKDGSIGSQKAINLAIQVQDRLIRLLKSEGLGADFSARGICRDLPNWRRKKPSEHSQAQQLFYNTDIHNKIKREKLSVLSELAKITYLIPECKKIPKKEQRCLLHGNKTTEARLAPLYVDLFENLGQCKCYTMAELVKITTISRATLRNILMKNRKRPKWLNVNYLGKSEGYELWIDPEYGDIERAEKLIKNPEYAQTFLEELPYPEEVKEGHRNQYVTSVAIHYKHHDCDLDQALKGIKSLISHIPGHRESNSCKNFVKIASSIYRNEPYLRGCKSHLPPPKILEEKFNVKVFTEGGVALENVRHALAFTRRGNEKRLVIVGDSKEQIVTSIVESVAVKGTGYKLQLAAIQELLAKLEQKPSKLLIKGRSMLQGNPVAKKFAKYYGFEFEFAERSKDDKRLIREFREDHHSQESECLKGISINLSTNSLNSKIASLLGGLNSYVVANGESRETSLSSENDINSSRGIKSLSELFAKSCNNSNWCLGLLTEFTYETWKKREQENYSPLREDRCGVLPIASYLPGSKLIKFDKSPDLMGEKPPFKFPEMIVKKVRCDGYITYLDNFYWLGDSWIGRNIKVVDDGTIVEFFERAQFIKRYKRLTGKGAKTEGGTNTQWHKAKSLDSTYRRKAKKVGPAFDQLILAQIEKGQGIINTQSIFSFLRLMDSWPYEQLEAVARYCARRRNYSYKFFNSCLEAGVE